jgi:hypothetical protein
MPQGVIAVRSGTPPAVPTCARSVVLRDRIVDLSGLVLAIASGDGISIAPGPTGHRVFEDALPDGSVEPVERDRPVHVSDTTLTVARSGSGELLEFLAFRKRRVTGRSGFRRASRH